MWTTLSIAGFGLLGIFSRYGLDTLALTQGQSKALMTLAINILGSLVAGFLVGFSPFGLDRPWKVGIVVGFCGGFTTFSGFSLHLLEFYTKGETQMAFLLGIVSPLLCFVGVFLGYLLGKQLVSY